MTTFSEATDLKKIAECLAHSEVDHLERIAGGGNNKILKVHFLGREPAALKCYFLHPSDTRARLSSEYDAFDFLNKNGVSYVPKTIARDATGGFALYEWVNGESVTAVTQHEIDQAVNFAKSLKDVSFRNEANLLKNASEACLSQQEIIYQIEGRFRRLAEECGSFPELKSFLFNQFWPLITKIKKEFPTTKMQTSKDCLTLSPSDFGFHNSLRRSDGNLFFLDFEYFGWDDPVKMTADFIWHPAMNLSISNRDRFVHQMVQVFSEFDTNFQMRLQQSIPLFGLRWCLILLNEYLPGRWERRVFADQGIDRENVLKVQLEKARKKFESVTNIIDGT